MKDTNYINEKETRQTLIDRLLRESGWTTILNYEEGKKYDFAAIREHPTKRGPADYILFHDNQPIAAIAAKKLSIGPQNVLVQAERYARGLENFDSNYLYLPFVYSTNGPMIRS